MAAERPHDAIIAALAASGDAGRALVERARRASPLGPIDGWPTAALLAAQLCLESGAPCVLLLGPDLILVHNDAYAPILGQRASTALLSPARDVWPEVWEAVGPSLREVWRTGRPLTVRDHLLRLMRNTAPEQAYFSYSLNPVRDVGGEVIGILGQVQETTEQVVAQRRLDTLHRLATDVSGAATAVEACRRGIDVLAANTDDVAFALAFGRDHHRGTFQLVADSGLDPQTVAALATAGAAKLPFAERHDELSLVADLPAALAAPTAPTACTLGGDSAGGTNRAVISRLPTSGEAPQLWLVLGLPDNGAVDEKYREFALLAGSQLAAGIDLAASLQSHRDRSAQLQIALETSRQIGTALGVLMAVRKVTEDEAFALLRDASQNTHRKLRDIAADVLLTGTLPG